MASTGKKKTTMAKLTRESRLRERRVEKEARKRARKYAAAHPPSQPDGDPAAVDNGQAEPSAESDLGAEQHPVGQATDVRDEGGIQHRS
jgi:hypothetical protein